MLLCRTLLSSANSGKCTRQERDVQGIVKEPEKQIPGIGHSVLHGLVAAGQWSAVSSDFYSRESHECIVIVFLLGFRACAIRKESSRWYP